MVMIIKGREKKLEGVVSITQTGTRVAADASDSASCRIDRRILAYARPEVLA